MLYVQHYNPKVDVLEGRIIVPTDEFLREPDIISKYIVDTLSGELAKSIQPYMDIKYHHYPDRLETYFNARVRLVRPDARL